MQAVVAAFVSSASTAFAAAFGIHCHLLGIALLRSLVDHHRSEADLRPLVLHFGLPCFEHFLDQPPTDPHPMQAQQLVGQECIEAGRLGRFEPGIAVVHLNIPVAAASCCIEPVEPKAMLGCYIAGFDQAGRKDRIRFGPGSISGR